jgi:PleD family two-component response regulator
MESMESKKVVLAIDDNAQQLREYEHFLASRYDLRVAKAASEALHFLGMNKSDVILLDIEMPNVSGFEFLHDIRIIPSYLYVPIIIVSSNTGKDFHLYATNSTAFTTLTKPVHKETLVETIEKALAATAQTVSRSKK